MGNCELFKFRKLFCENLVVSVKDQLHHSFILCVVEFKLHWLSVLLGEHWQLLGHYSFAAWMHCSWLPYIRTYAHVQYDSLLFLGISCNGYISDVSISMQ